MVRHPFPFSAALIAGALATTAPIGAETYRFAPAAFYSTLSATHPVALRIKSGDRVVTSTLDDSGAGPDGKAVVAGPLPLTGPFFVEGAEPGDLLVVTIATLEPNRATGSSTSIMAAGSVDPNSLSSRQDPRRASWTIDKTRNVVRLDLQTLAPNVNWQSRFNSPALEMPLRPALGAIGVAPAGDAQPASAAGPYGGNVMSTVITAGTRVMLPVLQPGALLFLGHGYARVGDGSVTSTGIETSLDVEFSVEVVKKKEWPHSSIVRPSTVVGEFTQSWPRIETGDAVMTIGCGPTLALALQHATLELHHWLDDDFGLSEKAVSILVGQAIEYEIASAIEPNVTVVAKVRKAYLPKAGPGTH